MAVSGGSLYPDRKTAARRDLARKGRNVNQLSPGGNKTDTCVDGLGGARTDPTLWGKTTGVLEHVGFFFITAFSDKPRGLLLERSRIGDL